MHWLGELAANPMFWGGLFAVSEALASIPALKANSIFQLMQSVVQSLAERKHD